MDINQKLKNLVPGWDFRIEEVSALHYVLSGRDQLNHTISCEGSDVLKLLESGREQALWVSHQVKSKSNSSAQIK